MPSFRTGRVTGIISERRGLQRIEVVLDGDDDASRAVGYPDLTGAVAVGDEVVCNTTAVELGLGTGGWHVVHWNLSRRSLSNPSGGHIMKLRYTSLQADVLAVSEERSPWRDAMRDERLDGMPVVAAGLHSLVAAVTAGVKHAERDLEVAYVMTDGGALPMALSDLVHDLREAGLIRTTVTAGNAFGGDLEAVTVASGLVAARHAGCDVAVVAMGPGVVGTGSATGTTAREVAHILTETAALGGLPVACLRMSGSDDRERHRGVSHHSLVALAATPALDPTVSVAVPTGDPDLAAAVAGQVARAAASHRIEPVDPGSALDILAEHGLNPTSMGRGISDDPVFWKAGAAAGVLAARHAVR